MSHRMIIVNGHQIVLTNLPNPPHPPPAHADTSTAACTTGARSSAQDGRPPPDERARLARTVGGILRRERCGRGWSTTQFADAAGVAVSTVWRLERGRCRPSEVMTRRLAVALRAETRRPVDAAVLDLELQAAAGDSLRRVRRRYPVRERRRRVYAEAAAMLAGRLSEAGADVQTGMLLAVLDVAARRAEGCGCD